MTQDLKERIIHLRGQCMKIIEMALVKQPTHILCNVHSKGNKDNRGDILVFRAFLFPLCSTSCCWITSFARLVPSHNGESLTMVGAKSWLCSTYSFWFSGCCLHRRQCQHFLSNSKLSFFWSSFSECTYYIIALQRSGMAALGSW